MMHLLDAKSIVNYSSCFEVHCIRNTCGGQLAAWQGTKLVESGKYLLASLQPAY